jgi:SGNH domain (fused to AT3 domains)
LASKKLMVVYGDSHAAMWAEALQIIAERTGWKLIVFALPGCPLPDLTLISAQTNGPNTQCQQFHVLAASAIKKLHPDLLVVTSESTGQTAAGVAATPSQWQSGLVKSFASLSEPGTSMVMIGDIPQWPLDDADCLALHMTGVQSCAASPAQAVSPNAHAEQAAAKLSGVRYISTTAWACASECEPVIGNIRVYFNQYHFGAIYTAYLSEALQEALGLAS